MTDGNHREIVRWLQERCVRARADLWLYADGKLGLRVGADGGDRVKPTAVLAPDGTFAGQGEYAGVAGVLMTVEVTSYDTDADADADTDAESESARLDLEGKPVAHAAAGIPLHLLIDRDARAVTVYSDPAPGGYRSVDTAAFGGKLVLPDPVGIELDTEILKEYVP